MNYLRRHKQGVEWDHPDHVEPLGLRQVINQLCIQSGSTYQGRIDAARILLKRIQNVPIYINESTLCFASHSLRHPDCTIVNVHNILDLYPDDVHTIVRFQDDAQIHISISLQQTKRYIKRSKQLYDQLVL